MAWDYTREILFLGALGVLFLFILIVGGRRD